MKRAKPAVVAKVGTRREDEILASIRKNLKNVSCLLGEEADEEELLKLTAGGLEEFLMGLMERAKGRVLGGSAERPITETEKEQCPKTGPDSPV